MDDQNIEWVARGEPPPPRLIEWTGERCVPWAPDYQMIYEHLHRYTFAAGYCAGKRVLDLASGEGYGSAELARVAREVVGVDIDAATVEHARIKYGSTRVQFLEGSILDTELFTNHPFDVVVCFEALEHVGDHDVLMKVILGALALDGLLIISTPDKEVYTNLHEQHNPFHVHELNRQEFRDLLGFHFKQTTLLTQEVAVGSVLQALDGGSGAELVRVSGVDDWARETSGEAPYLVALATNATAMIPSVPLISTLLDNDLFLARRPPSVTVLEASIEELRVALEKQVASDDAQIERLENSVRRLSSECMAAEDQLALTQAAVSCLTWEVGAIKATRGWQMLEKARGGYRAVRRLGRPLRRIPPFRRPR